MRRFLLKLLNLRKDEEDKETVLQNLPNNISFSGANFWILVCAIFIASIGLNVNSTAVIIGAMLISPLMGPIVASGFALGIYDFKLLEKALKNLLIATIVSLAVSFIYFSLSPFKEVQSELLARTSPNIYDILIAFFGGLVGVIAVTRVEKGNPIPGVAIATALMPPLCTAGYGLATGHWDFFFGALFLYCINCVFICISTYIIVKYLKYPAKTQPDERKQKQVKYGITILIILMVVPGIYFAFGLYKQQKFESDINLFINEEFTANGKTVIYKKTNYKSSPKTVELAFLSYRFKDSEKKQLNADLENFGIKNTKIIFRQDSINNIELLKSDILNEIQNKNNLNTQESQQIQLLQAELAKYKFDNLQYTKEARAAFPGINNISISFCHRRCIISWQSFQFSF
ncbi:MAG: TIGR00341 family protein [Pseudopedobacter saltans]|uniref:TIGR00341 family protein n=1 Tax=Pseudopedobacter saltans TaxID=151895 RepID=A0A2W5GBI7_9SPHI|nr:MAG: TIGR00341 family protein [Pseudopedobacter saltans]